MAFTSTHEIGKTRELISKIETTIGFDKKSGLVKAARLIDDPDAGHLDTFENLSLAINYALLGDAKRAEKILIAVEKYIGQDSDTGLFFNKLGVGSHEEKKVLPGEKTIYLSNQILIFILLTLLGKIQDALKLLGIVKTKFQKFSFHGQEIYQHAIGLSSFYAFNNLFMAIAELIASNLSESKKLTESILDLCWDKKVGLLSSAPREKIYFVLDNALLAWWYKLNSNNKKCRDIIRNIENKVVKDDETGLFYRGARQSLGKLEPIPPALTYTNSVLAISYLVSADIFNKNLFSRQRKIR